jgi:hypothetical protein
MRNNIEISKSKIDKLERIRMLFSELIKEIVSD